MTYAIDTSVLARIIHKNHPMQQIAKDAIKLLLSHGVTHLLTFNTDDFKRYSGISVISPSQVS